MGNKGKSLHHIFIIGSIALSCFVLVACEISSHSSVPKDSTTVMPPGKRKLPPNTWEPPSEATIPAGKEGDMIRYGRELIMHTALYFGPKGSIARISNGMNCQNCHLDAGTRFMSNNFAAVAASYPKMNYRAGKISPLSKRIMECFERSLNGRSPDTAAKAVRAMLAYIRWVGYGVKKGDRVAGTGTEKLKFMIRAADPVKGAAVYAANCQKCHGNNGEGLFTADKKSFQYPPLWGPDSYNDGAGMYMISKLAGFVKNNMPFGTTYQNPQLSDEQAWDVAAFINSQPRPHRDQRNDWKNAEMKPVDFPFGPYTDPFSEKQHKYGPFGPIKAVKDKAGKS